MKRYFIFLVIYFINTTVNLSAQDITLFETTYLATAETHLAAEELEQADSLCQAAIQAAVQAYGTPSEVLGALNYAIARLYERQRLTVKARPYLKKRVENYKALGNDYLDDLANSYDRLSRNYTNVREYDNAKSTARKGIQLEGKIRPQNLAALYNRLGIIYYFEKKDFHQALENFEAALHWRRIAHGDQHSSVASSYINIGIIYLDAFQDYEASLRNYQKGYEIHNVTLASDSPTLAKTCDNLGEAYSSLSNFEQAAIYRKQALEIRKKKFGEQHVGTATSYENLGRDLVKSKQFKDGIELIQRGLKIKTAQLSPKNMYVINGYKYIGHSFWEWGKLDSALVYIQQAIIRTTATFTNADIRTNPDLSKTIYDKPRLLENLNYKAQILYQKYQDKEQAADLETALQTYEVTIALIDQLREEYERSNSQESLLETAMPVYEKAIAANLEKYEQTGQKELLHNIFLLSEKSKATLLLEALREEEAKSFAGIPSGLLDLENEVQYELFQAEKKLYDAERKNESSEEELIAFKQIALKLHQRSDSIMNLLKSDYPDYHDLKYDIQLASIQEVRAILPSDSHTLLEYFIGQDNIYVCVLKRDSFDVVKIPKDFPLEDWIKNFHASIQNSAKPTVNTDTLVQYAHVLYQRLIAPIEAKHGLTEELTIIPDGILGYLPFELLIRTPYEETSLFNMHHYLIKDYSIAYSYSSTLLKEMYERQHTTQNNDFLAFAPTFDAAPEDARMGYVPTGFSSLEYNIPEVEELQNLVGGKIMTAAAATKQAFLEEAPKYSIVHLATHGMADDKVGDYAYLAFYEKEDKPTEYLLYNRDLYNLKLQADLVVLSACETGVGELKSGEGIISLARGFSYAGAKSILTTLWSINDAKTQELMLAFYAYMKKGMSKDKALRQAKLDFLDKYSHSAHPFYWAAFVPVGDMQAIDFSTQFSNWWLLGIFFIPLLLFFRKK